MFDDLDQSELGGLFQIYIHHGNFSESNKKNCFISFFKTHLRYVIMFMNLWKARLLLTNFQVSLSAYGSYYKIILARITSRQMKFN